MTSHNTADDYTHTFNVENELASIVEVKNYRLEFYIICACFRHINFPCPAAPWSYPASAAVVPPCHPCLPVTSPFASGRWFAFRSSGGGSNCVAFIVVE